MIRGIIDSGSNWQEYVCVWHECVQLLYLLPSLSVQDLGIAKVLERRTTTEVSRVPTTASELCLPSLQRRRPLH